MNATCHNASRRGHTLMELVVAMVASAVLLAGLGSVMMIGRQVAYTPSAAVRRTETADVINQIAEELRYATLIVQQTPQILEFVVADRNSDGTAEKIRYEWSGTPGDPLTKKVNSAVAVTVLDSINAFTATLQLKSKITALKTTTDSAEAVLVSNANVQSGTDRDITATAYSAQQLNPSVFASIPANAISWNATKIDFYGRYGAGTNDTLLVQLRSSGDPNDGPTSDVLSQTLVPEAALPTSTGWSTNTAVFANPARGLALHRRYAVTWSGIGSGIIAKLRCNDSAAGGVLESSDSGATWQFMTARQMYYRLYGFYTTPGPSYDVTRNFVSHVRLVLQSGDLAHARLDASVPLVNVPELLAAYWRADFNANPTATNANGDSVADWALASGGSFDTATLVNGVWYAAGALETRPPSDFTTTTTVEVRCRNTTVGGNGAVVRINADRQGSLYAPLLLYVQRQADGTQTVSLLGKTSDAATKQLFTRSRLAGDFIRFRLTIVPQSNIVNLQINDEDQGTFTYPTYAPSTGSDRFLTLYAHTSLAEFDYVDVRVAAN